MPGRWSALNAPHLKRQAVRRVTLKGRFAASDPSVAAIVVRSRGNALRPAGRACADPDDPHNRTRFVMIGKEPTGVSGNVIELADRLGREPAGSDGQASGAAGPSRRLDDALRVKASTLVLGVLLLHRRRRSSRRCSRGGSACRAWRKGRIPEDSRFVPASSLMSRPRLPNLSTPSAWSIRIFCWINLANILLPPLARSCSGLAVPDLASSAFQPRQPTISRRPCAHRQNPRRVCMPESAQRAIVQAAMLATLMRTRSNRRRHCAVPTCRLTGSRSAKRQQRRSLVSRVCQEKRVDRLRSTRLRCTR